MIKDTRDKRHKTNGEIIFAKVYYKGVISIVLKTPINIF